MMPLPASGVPRLPAPARNYSIGLAQRQIDSHLADGVTSGSWAARRNRANALVASGDEGIGRAHRAGRTRASGRSTWLLEAHRDQVGNRLPCVDPIGSTLGNAKGRVCAPCQDCPSVSEFMRSRRQPTLPSASNPLSPWATKGKFANSGYRPVDGSLGRPGVPGGDGRRCRAGWRGRRGVGQHRYTHPNGVGGRAGDLHVTEVKRSVRDGEKAESTGAESRLSGEPVGYHHRGQPALDRRGGFLRWCESGPAFAARRLRLAPTPADCAPSYLTNAATPATGTSSAATLGQPPLEPPSLQTVPQHSAGEATAPG